jgi:hypothetical protein
VLHEVKVVSDCRSLLPAHESGLTTGLYDVLSTMYCKRVSSTDDPFLRAVDWNANLILVLISKDE